MIREGKTFQLYSIMQTSKGAGMVTLNDSLMQFVKSNTVSPEEAFMKAVNKDELKLMFDKAGIKVELQTSEDGT